MGFGNTLHHGVEYPHGLGCTPPKKIVGTTYFLMREKLSFSHYVWGTANWVTEYIQWGIGYPHEVKKFPLPIHNYVMDINGV